MIRLTMQVWVHLRMILKLEKHGTFIQKMSILLLNCISDTSMMLHKSIKL